jgi:hypothetical protein
MRVLGRARDLVTDSAGDGRVTADATLQILASPQRQILQIEAAACDADLLKLVGMRPGGKYRRLVHELLSSRGLELTPLHLLMDDFVGASLVATWAWSRWLDDWHTILHAHSKTAGAGRNGSMGGVCTGFAPGASSLDDAGNPRLDIQSSALVGPLVRPDDPLGWHELPQQVGMAGRRARRMDVWVEGDVVHISAGFQDGGTTPDGARGAVHEYRVNATADAASLKLTSVTAEPRVLPFAECPGATGEVRRLLGARLETFRTHVPETLAATLGCTHLNDVLRTFADVPKLLETWRIDFT